MITVGIVGYNEEKTFGAVLDKWISQNWPEDYGIIAEVGGTDNTQKIAADYANKYPKVKALIEKKSKGKPNALNQIFKRARGRILILTDGDVFPDKDAVKYILERFNDEKIGAVSGRPVPLNSRKTMFGFWQHLLCDVTNSKRLQAAQKEKFHFASGYLYAIRAEAIKKIKNVPEDALADDAYISHAIDAAGYKIGYAPKAFVYVQYPTNFKDWVKQKRRTIAGSQQISMWFPKASEKRSFGKEAGGFFSALRYCGSAKELAWFFALCFARVYVWLLGFIDLRIKKKGFKEIWKRVESAR